MIYFGGLAVRGPPPTTPRLGSPRSGGSKGSSKVVNTRRPRARKPALGKPTVVDTGEEEERVGEERHRAAELEEEERRHRSLDSEAERLSEEELEARERLARISWGEEKKKRGRRKHKQDDDEDEDAEDAKKAAEEAQAKGLVEQDAAGKYFQDLPEDRLGDLTLVDPNEMRRLLGASARFAQHAMILAQHRLENCGQREEALAYLANLYVGLEDRAYARKALREFGPATGILDIYPLEVFDYLLEFVPAFFDRVERGTLFARSNSESDEATFETQVGQPIELDYDETLRIRGFALKGGERPGYLFEPLERSGAYQLVFLSAGSFLVLVSAISRDGKLVIDELVCHVSESSDHQDAKFTGIERERGNERTEAKKASSEDESGHKTDPLKIHFPRRI